MMTRTAKSPRTVRYLMVGFLVCLMTVEAGFGEAEGFSPPNVLFIAVDDLRPQTGAYGHVQMVTPNMDRLATEGRLFTRHYVQVPTCGASRYSLLSGQFPVQPITYGNDAFELYRRGEGPPSLPEWFRRHGYATVSIGKITHSPDGLFPDEKGAVESPELPGAWNEVGAPRGEWDDGQPGSRSAILGYAGGKSRVRGKSPPTESADVDDHGYPDALLADAAVERLRVFRKESDRPFFLAVGFYKPHLPFCAPQSYWDLYCREAIPLPAHREPPLGVDPRISLHRGGEFFGNYGHSAKDVLDEDYVRKMVHGYFAATSYVDAQVGRVLDALEEFGLTERTIVVLWGDHGYHLGELGVWGKHTLHERSLRTAFIVRTPDMRAPGIASEAITGSIDVYPTLLDLCGLAVPEHLDGVSFADLLVDPSGLGSGEALGFWRGGRGHSLRNDRYRITRWADGEGDVRQIELYDHQQDPEETRNLAAYHEELVAHLLARLDERLAARKAPAEP